MCSTSRFLLFVVAVVTSLLSGACGDGEISGTPRSSDATPDTVGVDNPSPDLLDVNELPPGVQWWEVVEKPDTSNTGPNCSAAGCPSATLVDLGACPNVSTPGTTLENFRCTGRMDIEAKNVTLRNFYIYTDTYQAIRVRDTNTGSPTNLLMEYGELDGTGNQICGELVGGIGWTARYMHMHDCDDVTKPALDTVQFHGWGPVLVENSYMHNPNGGHGDTFQNMPNSTGHKFTARHNVLQGGRTSIVILTNIADDWLLEENWMEWGQYGECGNMIYCNHDGSGVIRVINNLIDGQYSPCTRRGSCVWSGNLWSDDLTSVP